MARDRKAAAIKKPLIDEEAVLRFVAAAPDAAGAGKPEESGLPGDHIQLTVTLKRDLYAALEREAGRKSRSVEELVRKFLAKHFGD